MVIMDKMVERHTIPAAAWESPALALDIHRQVGAHRCSGGNDQRGPHLPRNAGKRLEQQHCQQGG